MSAYFFNLEKSRAKYNSVLQLNVNGTIIENKNDISKICFDYYSNYKL